MKVRVKELRKEGGMRKKDVEEGDRGRKKGRVNLVFSGVEVNIPALHITSPLASNSVG